MKTCYLAGPYRADDYEKYLNFMNNVNLGAKYLFNQGYAVFSPHLNFRYAREDEKTPAGREKILEMCLEFVKKCDLIAFLPDWTKSEGCLLEYNMALRIKKDIIILTNEQIQV